MASHIHRPRVLWEKKRMRYCFILRQSRGGEVDILLEEPWIAQLCTDQSGHPKNCVFHHHVIFHEQHLTFVKRERCLKVAGENLAQGKSVAIGELMLLYPNPHFERILLTLVETQTIQMRIPMFEENGWHWLQSTECRFVACCSQQDLRYVNTMTLSEHWTASYAIPYLQLNTFCWAEPRHQLPTLEFLSLHVKLLLTHHRWTLNIGRYYLAWLLRVLLLDISVHNSTRASRISRRWLSRYAQHMQSSYHSEWTHIDSCSSSGVRLNRVFGLDIGLDGLLQGGCCVQASMWGVLS